MIKIVNWASRKLANPYGKRKIDEKETKNNKTLHCAMHFKEKVKLVHPSGHQQTKEKKSAK